MAKGKKVKSKSNTKKTVAKYPPPIILKTWPGKLTDQQVEERHQKLLQESINDCILLRIRQVDWKFHDFFIMIDIETTVFALQQIISQIQHQSAVLPSDVLIYKSTHDASVSDVYQPYDRLELSKDLTRISRGNSPWPIGQPIYVNNPNYQKDLNYLNLNYDILPFMNLNVQRSLTDQIWKPGVFNNSLVMTINDYTNKSTKNRQQSMIQTKK